MNKLRWMRRHVGAKDRDTLEAAVAAIEELATRLHEATHVVSASPRMTGGVKITTVADDEHAGPVQTGVID